MPANSLPSDGITRQLIVCGFHRSGTSLTMQALKNAGLYIGDNLMAAHPSNPDGHFEDNAIVALHNDMLASADRQWHTPGSAVSPDASRYSGQAKSIIDNYAGNSAVWGFKDPRTCLFMDFWHERLPSPASVLVYRHYLSCYRSLRNRQAQILAHNPGNNLDNLQFWQQPLLGLQLWVDSNQALLRYIEEHPDTTVLVSCEAMLSGYNLVQRVNDKLGLNLDAESDSGIRTGSGNATLSLPATIPDGMRAQLQDTLAALDERADSSTNTGKRMLSVPGKLDASEVHKHTENLLDQLQIDDTDVSESAKSVSDSTKPKPVIARLVDTQPPSSAKNGAEYLLEQIDALMQKDASDKALSLAEQEIEHYPNHLKLQLTVGKLYLEQQLFAKAETHFNIARKLKPQDVSPLVFLATNEKRRQNPLKAAHYWYLIIDQQPDNTMAYLHLAQALDSAGRPESALREYDKGLSLEPENPALQRAKLNNLVKSGEAEKAIEYTEHLMRLNPDVPHYRLKNAELNAQFGKPELAMHYYYQSTWLKMQAMKDYRQALQVAIEKVADRSEAVALRQQINTELEKLLHEICAARESQNFLHAADTSTLRK